jgi:hypothetical protein
MTHATLDLPGRLAGVRCPTHLAARGRRRLGHDDLERPGQNAVDQRSGQGEDFAVAGHLDAARPAGDHGELVGAQGAKDAVVRSVASEVKVRIMKLRLRPRGLHYRKKRCVRVAMKVASMMRPTKASKAATYP